MLSFQPVARATTEVLSNATPTTELVVSGQLNIKQTGTGGPADNADVERGLTACTNDLERRFSRDSLGRRRVVTIVKTARGSSSSDAVRTQVATVAGRSARSRGRQTHR